VSSYNQNSSKVQAENKVDGSLSGSRRRLQIKAQHFMSSRGKAMLAATSNGGGQFADRTANIRMMVGEHKVLDRD
jgi:hypothetical protein